MKRKCNKCGAMRTEEEFYTAWRKVCCYCDRKRQREYKRAQSKTWTGEVREKHVPVPIKRRKEKGIQEIAVIVKKPIPECVRVHVESLKRLKGLH